MSSQSLINKIENLSTTLSTKQLATFLDIMDDMATMVKEAHALPAKSLSDSPKPSKQPAISPLH